MKKLYYKLYYKFYNIIEFVKDLPWWIPDFFKDLWWWATDRKPFWEDAEPCKQKLCRFCGNYPFKN